MATFKFRLETLKRYRKDQFLRAQKQLSDVNGDFLEAKSKWRQLNVERSDLLSKNATCIEAVGQVKVFSELIRISGIKIKKGEQLLEVKEREVARLKQWVQHLNRELRVVEKLEEKERKRFDLEQKKKENKALDGWVNDQWTRK